MKSNRRISFLILFLVYIIAGVLGFWAFRVTSGPAMYRLFYADFLATVIVFFFSVVLKNASCYDPYWSVAPPVMICFLLTECRLNAVRLLILVPVFFWAVRLTLNWAYTFQNLNSQDWRYTRLHEKCGKWYPFINFIGIHLVPTLIVYFCMLPVCLCYYREVTMSPRVVLFASCGVMAAVFQGISDLQMHRFRKAHKGGFIRSGLWKYSRHPNYLGEILMWWSMGLMSIIAMQGSLFLLAGAFLNTCLFLFVSIPMADAHQRDRKPDFESYKEETRMLLPVKKKNKK